AAANAAGAEVLSVRPGGPADRVGIKTGDVVTAIRGKEVLSDADVAEAVKDLAVHETVAIQYRRRGVVTTVRLTAVEVPTPSVKPEAILMGGALVAEFGPLSETANRSGRST